MNGPCPPLAPEPSTFTQRLTPALGKSPLRDAIRFLTRAPEPDLLPGLVEQARLPGLRCGPAPWQRKCPAGDSFDSCAAARADHRRRGVFARRRTRAAGATRRGTFCEHQHGCSGRQCRPDDAGLKTAAYRAVQDGLRRSGRTWRVFAAQGRGSACRPHTVARQCAKCSAAGVKGTSGCVRSSSSMSLGLNGALSMATMPRVSGCPRSGAGKMLTASE